MRRYLLEDTRLLPAVFIVCVALAAALFVRHEQQLSERKSAYFESALENARIRESVQVGGRTLIVSGENVISNDGSVSSAVRLEALILAYEKTLARRAPILPLPGIPADDMRDATKRLASNADILSLYARDRGDMTREYLYPIRYLAALADNEDARRTFLSDASERNANAYRAATRSLIAAYEDDLAAFKRAFVTLVPEDIGSYATPRYLVGRTDILKSFDLFAQKADELRSIVRMRDACVRGIIRLCDPSQLELPNVGATIDDRADSALALEIRRILRSAGLPVADSPLVQLSSGACVEERAGTGGVFGFESIPGVGDAPPYLAPLFLSDILFMDAEKLHGLPFYTYFQEHGVRYVFTRPVAYYSCPHADVDIHNVVMTARTGSFARSHAIPWPSGSQDLLAQADALAYLRDMRQRLRDGSLRDDKGDFTELLLENSSGSWGLYHTVMDIVTGERTEMQINQRGLGIEFDPMLRFYLRSGFVSFFGFFLDENERLSLFPGNHVPDSERPFVYYTNMDLAPETLAKLRADIGYYVSVHDVDELPAL